MTRASSTLASRAVRRDLERLDQRLFGVPRIVVVEEELGPPQERLDATRFAGRDALGALALVVGAVRVLRVPQEVHRATHHRQPLGVARGDGVAAVLVGELEEQRLGVGAATGADEQLAQHEAHAATADARPVLARSEEVDGLVDLALGREDLSPERGGRQPLVGARRRLLRRAIGLGEAPLLEANARHAEERRGSVGTRDGQQRLLGGRVVGLSAASSADARALAGRGVRGRRGLRASRRTPTASTAPRWPTAPGDRLVS